jgi:hypothetical protein
MAERRSQWLFLSETFTLPCSSSSKSNSQSVFSRPYLLTLGSVILGGHLDLFPTYESTSLIQISSSSSSSTTTTEGGGTTLKKYNFFQNKSLSSQEEEKEEMIVCGTFRALEALGQGVMTRDHFGTYFEANQIFYHGLRSELMTIDLHLLLVRVFKSTLEELLPFPSARSPSAPAPSSSSTTPSADPSTRSRPFVICVPTPMSLQAKGRLMEAIVSASIGSPNTVHVRSILRSGLSSSSLYLCLFLTSIAQPLPSPSPSSSRSILRRSPQSPPSLVSLFQTSSNSSQTLHSIANLVVIVLTTILFPKIRLTSTTRRQI